MTATTQQLLQPAMGVRLPAGVRRALIEMGEACNQAALLMHHAFGFSMQAQALLDSQRAAAHPGRLAEQVAADLHCLSDQNFERAIVVLARAGAVYANYASLVAAAVAADMTPPMPGSGTIRPSEIITACAIYLPEVHFAVDSCDPAVVRDQNQAIATTRGHLNDLITHQLQGEPVLAYDEIAGVAAAGHGDGDTGRSAEFASTLHAYAATLVWAVGVFSGAKPDDTGGPRTADHSDPH